MTEDPLRLDKEALRRAIIDAGGVGFHNRDAGKCPFHEDRSPSGSIFRDADGVYRFKCHSPSCGFTGDIFDVRARVEGLTLGQVLPKNTNERTDANHRPIKAGRESRTFSSIASLTNTIEGTLEGVWEYPGAGPIVIRYRPPGSSAKRFLQARRIQEGFAFGGPPKPHPFLNIDQLKNREKLVIVEGEKTRDALSAFGYPVTCWPGGCKAVRHADLKPLAGKKLVLWPDNDAGGIDAMRILATDLLDLDPNTQIKIVNSSLLNLDKAGDAADFIAEMSGLDEAEKREELKKVFESARPFGPGTDFEDHLDKVHRGEFRPVNFPFPLLSQQSQALYPGNVLILAGGPGVSKSFLVIQCLIEWQRVGIPTASFFLEGDGAFHISRALSQIAGEAGMANPNWVECNPDQSRGILEEHRDFVSTFAERISCATDQPSDHDSVLAWLERKAQGGARLLIVDPVTMMEVRSGRKVWDEDLRFIKGVRAICREHGASFLGVSHPSKNWDEPSLSTLAGGAAYARFSDAVLWIHYEEGRHLIHGAAGDLELQVDRIVSILKSRQGPGANRHIGFRWNSASLTFEELGLIARKTKGRVRNG